MSRKRLFIGSVGVVPRCDLKRYLEERPSGVSTDAALQSHLQQVLQLQSPPPESEIDRYDYAIDIFVAKHQSGESGHVQFGEYGIPFLWRPMVEVRSRLYALQSGKSLMTLRVKRHMPWSEYLDRSFSFKGLFGWTSAFRNDDLSRLLDEALIQTLEKVRTRL